METPEGRLAAALLRAHSHCLISGPQAIITQGLGCLMGCRSVSHVFQHTTMQSSRTSWVPLDSS